MERKKCVIIIPIYKKYNELTEFERKSFKQVCKVMCKWDIVLIHGESFNDDEYNMINNSIKHECFDDKYFSSISGYNMLCTEKKFYDRFIEYEYILIYQLDAWIFEDRLKYFLDLGYDYIGSPHFDNIHKHFLVNGNGGLSLRKTNIMRNLCETFTMNERKYNSEDILFSTIFGKYIKKAPILICMEFSWQQNPEDNYEIIKKLPMGFHSPFKYSNYKFWEKYL